MLHSLVAVAWVGHTVLMIGSHNRFYGMRLSKLAGDVVHLVHAVLVPALPVWVYLMFGAGLEKLLFWAEAGAPARVLQLYLLACLLVALIWLPGVTLYRLLRRGPGRELSRTDADLGREITPPPLGRGHQWWLGKLPGNEILRFALIEIALPLKNLPDAWAGLTVLHLSDLHLHGTPSDEYFRAVIDRCNALEPDIVAVTGDLVDTPTHHRRLIPLLGRLRAKVAVVAILGNHDHRLDVGPILRRLKRLRFLVPSNAATLIDVRGVPMAVIGHEGPWLDGDPDLSAVPEGVFRLCLSHTPDNIAWARRNRIDLMLSGHVHGGQIRVWPFGSILVPSRYGRAYDRGTFDESPTVLHVTSGLGGEHPVRYGCPPEAVLLRLEKA